MRKSSTLILFSCCLFAVAAFALAQAARKPGLWEMTTTMTWQKSPMPAGITMPAGMKSPFSGTTINSQVCLTQEMIDKYGAPMSQNKDCQVTNISMKASSMTADMVCSGRMNGKGTVEASWADSDHAKSKVHFEGVMQAGPNSMPVEWTSESTSLFKGSDCGSVKPLPMPGK